MHLHSELQYIYSRAQLPQILRGEHNEVKLHNSNMMDQATDMLHYWTHLFDDKYDGSTKPVGRVPATAADIDTIRHKIERDAVTYYDIRTLIFPYIGVRLRITVAQRYALLPSIAVALERMAMAELRLPPLSPLAPLVASFLSRTDDEVPEITQQLQQMQLLPHQQQVWLMQRMQQMQMADKL